MKSTPSLFHSLIDQEQRAYSHARSSAYGSRVALVHKIISERVRVGSMSSLDLEDFERIVTELVKEFCNKIDGNELPSASENS